MYHIFVTHMKTVNVRTVRHDFAAVLDLIRNGETVAVQHRKTTVALLTPPLPARVKPRQPWAGLRARLARLQAQPMAAQTAVEMLTAERERF
jgi:antitoxin (DNA-binding transcriptional repressor) of toxin-antitoxin stability system